MCSGLQLGPLLPPELAIEAKEHRLLLVNFEATWVLTALGLWVLDGFKVQRRSRSRLYVDGSMQEVAWPKTSKKKSPSVSWQSVLLLLFILLLFIFLLLLTTIFVFYYYSQYHE